MVRSRVAQMLFLGILACCIPACLAKLARMDHAMSTAQLARVHQETWSSGGNIPMTRANEDSPDTPPHNTEAYGHYQENPYCLVSRDPLSTFSVDVDTAAYSNVRRFLHEGKLPPKDAVRLAELINYFEYDYPAPQGEHPIAIHLEGAPCPWKDKHRLIRVALKAKAFTSETMPPRNLVFLIDVSGSMSDPKKLPLVQASLRLLVEQLTAKDRVAIVTYAGDTTVRLPSTNGSEKRTILKVIDELRSGGSTNGGSGIELAYQQAKAGFLSEGVNRVILATDGDFNVGTTSEGDLVRLIEEKRKLGVYLTILGYGLGNLKDSTLRKLSTHGDGHYAYIDSLDEARKVFVDQGGALAAVAKDVKLQVEFNPAQVHAYRLIGYEHRQLKAEDFKNDAKDAGDMGSGHSVTALYEIVPVGVESPVGDVDPLKYQREAKPIRKVDSSEWMTVKVRYKQPGGGASREFSSVLTHHGMKLTPSTDFRFAVAVTAFGLLLRDSEYKGTAHYAGTYSMAKDALGSDKNGYRAEFLKLIRLAESLEKTKPHEEVKKQDQQ